MRGHEDGQPLVGNGGNMLGARPVDIEANENGDVKPRSGGMSVTPNDARLLPLHLRPERLGGKGRLPVFELHVADVVDALVVRRDPRNVEKHAFIEPGALMQLVAYQAALASTRTSWRRLP